jgi:CRP-like cAMP-binding protein
MNLDLDQYYFANAQLFSDVCSKERLRLSTDTETKRIKAGKVIYKEGSEPKGVYILKKGKVKIFQTTPSGRKHIVYIYTAGEVFGYRPIICHGLHPVTAMTLEDCTIDRVSVENFRDCLHHCPELCGALLKSLSHEFTVWVNTVAVHAQYPVRSRVALSLLVLREKYKGKQKIAEIDLGRDDLAGFVGAVKESVVRMLQEFKRERLIETRGRKILVLKPEELKRIVRFY